MFTAYNGHIGGTIGSSDHKTKRASVPFRRFYCYLVFLVRFRELAVMIRVVAIAIVLVAEDHVAFPAEAPHIRTTFRRRQALCILTLPPRGCLPGFLTLLVHGKPA